MKINEKNLVLFATSQPYDCEGFLNKRGEVNKAFQRRYFVLKGNLLFYFEKKSDKEPLGLIIVEGCTIELSEENDQYCFEIVFNGNRSYVLSADSQDSMEKWMKKLTCAGYEYKKLMVSELQRQLEEIELLRNKMFSDNPTLSTVGAASVPKPPPRRQNPFNRPAPPIPVLNKDLNPAMPFIHGHFGSSTSQRNLHNNSNNNNAHSMHSVVPSGSGTSPLPPPRGLSAASGSSGSSSSRSAVSSKSDNINAGRGQTVFESSSLTPANNNNNNSSINSSHTALRMFEQQHEQYRKLVMNDVRSYQTKHMLKMQPLIDL